MPIKRVDFNDFADFSGYPSVDVEAGIGFTVRIYWQVHKMENDFRNGDTNPHDPRFGEFWSNPSSDSPRRSQNTGSGNSSHFSWLDDYATEARQLVRDFQAKPTASASGSGASSGSNVPRGYAKPQGIQSLLDEICDLENTSVVSKFQTSSGSTSSTFSSPSVEAPCVGVPAWQNPDDCLSNDAWLQHKMSSFSGFEAPAAPNMGMDVPMEWPTFSESAMGFESAVSEPTDELNTTANALFPEAAPSEEAVAEAPAESPAETDVPEAAAAEEAPSAEPVVTTLEADMHAAFSRTSHRRSWLVGMALGTLVAAVFLWNTNARENAFLGAVQHSDFEKIAYQSTSSNLLKTDLQLKDLQYTHKNPQLNMQVQSMDAELAFQTYPGQPLHVKCLHMNGVKFPQLNTKPQETAADDKTSFQAFFLADLDSTVQERLAHLDSLAYMDGVQQRHVPQYTQLCEKLQSIESAMDAIRNPAPSEQTVLHADFMESKAESISSALSAVNTATSIAATESKDAQLSPQDIEQLVQLYSEAEALKKQWCDINVAVAQDLGGIREYVIKDSQDISRLMERTEPNETILGDVLYSQAAKTKLAQSCQWIDALTQMVQAGFLGQNGTPVDLLETTGELPLYGQNLPFVGRWTRDGEQITGQISLKAKDGQKTDVADPKISVVCDLEDGRIVKRHVTAELPLGLETVQWGANADLALVTESQNGSLKLDLTLCADEVQGEMTMTLNQLKYLEQEPSSCKAFAQLQKETANQTKDSLQIHYQLTKTLAAPQIAAESAWTQELLPAYKQVAFELNQQKREEAVTLIYNRLKEAEVAFNNTMVPLYNNMLDHIKAISQAAPCKPATPVIAKNTLQAQIQNELAAQVANQETPKTEAIADASKDESVSNTEAVANLIVKYQKNKDDANTEANLDADAPAESVAAAENAAETAPESAVASADMDEEDVDSLYVPYFNPNIGIEKDEIMPQIGAEVSSRSTEGNAEESNTETSSEEDTQVTYAPIRKVDIQTIEQETLTVDGANPEAEETSPMAEILKAATPTVSESAPVPETFHTTKASAMPMAMSQGSITQDKTPMGTDKVQTAPVSAPAVPAAVAPAMSAPAASAPAPEIPASAATAPIASTPAAVPSTTAPIAAVPTTTAAPSTPVSAAPANSSDPALSPATTTPSREAVQDEAPKAKRSVFANLFSSSKNQQEAQRKPNTQQTNQMNESKPANAGKSNQWKSYSGF